MCFVISVLNNRTIIPAQPFGVSPDFSHIGRQRPRRLKVSGGEKRQPEIPVCVRRHKSTRLPWKIVQNLSFAEQITNSRFVHILYCSILPFMCSVMEVH